MTLLLPFSPHSPSLAETENRRTGESAKVFFSVSPLRFSVFSLLFFLPLLSFGSPARAESPPDTAKVIDEIIIRNLGVFDPEVPRYARFPYTLLNHLHVKTRARVIRRELLFRPGERFNEDLAEESARNLRKFPFLGHVAITPVTQRDTVRVIVTTEDQWTTNPDIVIDRRGNLSKLGIGLEEENFLGLGKGLKIRLLTSTDRNLWRVIYEDPRLLGSRYSLKTVGIRASDGSLVEGRLTRPLYALSARWSFDGGYIYEDSIDQLYEEGRHSASVRTRRHTGNLSLTRVRRDLRPHQKISLNLAVESRAFPDRVDVSLPSAPSARALLATGPVERRNLRAEVAWGFERLRFAHRRFIDQAELIEDVSVGQSATFTLGQALGLGGRHDTYGLLSASLVESAAIGETHLVILSAEGGTHIEGGQINNKTFTAFYHHYYQGLPSQTLLFGVAYLRTWRVDQPFQFVLGEDVGLRGYPARQFTGDRLLLFNFEDRVFTPVEFATFRLGFAAFFDAGMASARRVGWGDLRTSAGVSLRLAFKKFAGAPVFRLDLSFPFRRAPGMNRYSIGFSFDPIFRSFEGPHAVVRRF